MTDKALRAAIGYGIYGPSYDEAHADPFIWAHLVEEQDRAVERVRTAMAANGWRPVHDGLQPVHDPSEGADQ